MVQTLPEQVHLTRRRLHQPQQHFHGGGLAGPVRPQKAVHDPARNLQLQRIHHRLLTEPLSQSQRSDYIHLMRAHVLHHRW